MAEDLFNWLGVVVAIVLGLGFVLEPTLISALPRILHYLFGLVLIILGGFGAYKLAK